MVRPHTLLHRLVAMGLWLFVLLPIAEGIRARYRGNLDGDDGDACPAFSERRPRGLMFHGLVVAVMNAF
jgi:hypothetical protein